MEDTCEAIGELVCWVANGTAEASEQQLVHRHIAHCAKCRRELAQVLALRAEVRRSMSAPRGLPAGDWSELEAALSPYLEDRGHQLIRRLASAMDLLGLPGVLSSTLCGALDLTGYRLALRVNLPIVADVDVAL